MASPAGAGSALPLKTENTFQMIEKNESYLAVSPSTQRVELRRDDHVIWSAPISTSSKGLGETEGSHQTPRGWFSICEKIGTDAVIGTVFKSRKPTGEIWSPEQPPSEDDLILTRILWLDGLEAPNANTKERYIYFHGTNQEKSIGQPTSHGCIRLRNPEMIELFDQVSVGTKVWIEDDLLTSDENTG